MAFSVTALPRNRQVRAYNIDAGVPREVAAKYSLQMIQLMRIGRCFQAVKVFRGASIGLSRDYHGSARNLRFLAGCSPAGHTESS